MLCTQLTCMLCNLLCTQRLAGALNAHLNSSYLNNLTIKKMKFSHDTLAVIIEPVLVSPLI